MPIAFSPVADPADDDRYARQRLIPWWDQDRLAAAHIVIAGAGALGNEVLKNLALLGVGRVTIVDFDTVSPSNLARTVLFRPEDVGQPKAAVAARRAMELNPDCVVTPIHGDLARAVGLGTLAAADIVIGCLDNLGARWAINRRCMLVGTPWINGGISDTEGQVSRYVPGSGACYACTLTPRQVSRFSERFSCTGLRKRVPDNTMPTTAITASLVAARQVHDAVRYLHDPATGLPPGHRVTTLLDAHREIVDLLPPSPGCPVCAEHRAAANPILSHRLNPSSTAADVATAAGQPDADVGIGFDLLVSFSCRTCGKMEQVFKPAALVFEEEAACPDCRRERLADVTDAISADSPLRTVPLGTLGIAPSERLPVHVSGGSVWVEIGS